MFPAEQRRKAGEIRVGGDPFAAAFYGDGCVRGIRHDISLQLPIRAQLSENCPMIRPRPDQAAARSFQESVKKPENLSGR